MAWVAWATSTCDLTLQGLRTPFELGGVLLLSKDPSQCESSARDLLFTRYGTFLFSQGEQKGIEMASQRRRTLCEEYYEKARVRRFALDVLQHHEGHADVVREAQELVELLLKGLLRKVGIDPPKWHDVGSVLEDNEDLLPENVQQNLNRIVKISSSLRRDRELSFYGDEDFLPSEKYGKEESQVAIEQCDFLLALLKPHMSFTQENLTS